MPFEFTPLEIPEVVYIISKQFGDLRGVFAELYKASEFAKHGINISFLQMNQSVSEKNVLRGLHYQKNPSAQGKLLSVMSGEIFDVAVDIRVGSKTYGQWVSKTLSAKEKNMLYVPAGFAHGFCVTSQEAQVVYYCTQEYDPKAERGIIWNDDTLRIPWPTNSPLLSAKDEKYPPLSEADNNFSV